MAKAKKQPSEVKVREDVVVHDYIVKGNAVAWCNVMPFQDGVFLFRLWVRPEYRCKGIANKLVESVIRKAKNRPVYLKPARFHDGEMETGELAEWYLRKGFQWGKCGDTSLMCRDPAETS